MINIKAAKYPFSHIILHILVFTEFDGEKGTNCDTGHWVTIRPQMNFLKNKYFSCFIVTNQGSEKVSTRKTLKKTKQNFIL